MGRSGLKHTLISFIKNKYVYFNVRDPIAFNCSRLSVILLCCKTLKSEIDVYESFAIDFMAVSNFPTWPEVANKKWTSSKLHRVPKY